MTRKKLLSYDSKIFSVQKEKGKENALVETHL